MMDKYILDFVKTVLPHYIDMFPWEKKQMCLEGGTKLIESREDEIQLARIARLSVKIDKKETKIFLMLAWNINPDEEEDDPYEKEHALIAYLFDNKERSDPGGKIVITDKELDAYKHLKSCFERCWGKAIVMS